MNNIEKIIDYLNLTIEEERRNLNNSDMSSCDFYYNTEIQKTEELKMLKRLIDNLKYLYNFKEEIEIYKY